MQAITTKTLLMNVSYLWVKAAVVNSQKKIIPRQECSN